MLEITKYIEIDAAHRVTNHNSKCRNLHGHRYKVEITLVGPPIESGSQQGMVMDFGFMKDLLMQHVHAPCDHGTICWVEDTELLHRLVVEYDPSNLAYHLPNYTGFLDKIIRCVEAYGSFEEKDLPLGKAYFVPFVPTAENLAKHWHDRIAPRVHVHAPKAVLKRVRVWETPTSYVDYEAPIRNGR